MPTAESTFSTKAVGPGSEARNSIGIILGTGMTIGSMLTLMSGAPLDEQATLDVEG